MKHYYHGTNILIGEIDIRRSRLRTDFGKGFYVGTNLGEARKWAASQSMLHETPTVIRYTLSDVIFNLNDNSLRRLWFSAPTVEWLDFVRDNRRLVAPDSLQKEPRHDYDVVYGPVANDKVVDVVDDYIDGKVTADEAIARVRVIKSVYQISFHTALSLSYINQSLTEFQQRLHKKKWSEWKALQ
jgi:hypothetical protein